VSSILLASFNIQAGIGSRKPRHLITHGLRYALPHREAESTLDAIAETIASWDIVVLQELELGGLRSGGRNQLLWLAQKARFSHFAALRTRRIGRLAQIGIGILSRYPILRLFEHRLPGSRHGRGAIEAEILWAHEPITVIATHLSLRRRARWAQMFYLASLIRAQRTVLAGDLNCAPRAPEMRWLLAHTPLRAPRITPPSWPSWAPLRAIDHVLTTPDLRLDRVFVPDVRLSDHRPIVAEIRLR